MNGPTAPVHGALRLAWIRAMEQTNHAQERYQVALDLEGGTEQKEDALAAAVRAELIAGRAYLTALETHDPCCTSCGCTTLDGCGPIRCYWVSTSPFICSNCKPTEAT
jgi:hypothetical protein